MKSLFQFIISTDNRYNNKKDIDGKELIVNTEITERDAGYVNRVGVIETIPTAIETPIKVGDKIIVHHNVFRTWYNQHGDLSDGSGFLGNGLFSVHLDQIFAYDQGDGWISVPGYVFVAPIKEDTPSDLLAKALGEVPLRGTVKISNDGFEERTGAVCCSEVGFTPNSEYEFIIDKEKLYRIRENDINIVYGLQKRETENHSIQPSSA